MVMVATGCISMTLAWSVLISILAVGGAASDEAALLAFRAGLSPGALASWNSSGGFCRWYGVVCSSRRRRPGRVVALSLASSNLSGTLSPAIGNLTFLRVLNLSSNALHGGIPETVGRLRRLTALDVGHNSISGALPANLSSCVSLEYLRLEYNQLGGRVPPDIGNTLARLQSLVLRNNSFTGPVPASLANLSSLRYLAVDGNHLGGPIPPGLGGIAGLQHLHLDQNRLDGELPRSLWNLSSLVAFQVNYNMLHGSIPPDIGDKLPAIQYLWLDGNRFSGAIPPSLFNLSGLVSLGLSLNGFTGLVPPTIGSLRSVTSLYLGENQLEADDGGGWEFVASLANCSSLQVLTLSDNYFSGQLPRAVANLSTTLQQLYLHNNSISGSIPEGIGNLVGLDLLSLGINPISGVIPESLGRLTNLVTLGLYSTSLAGHIPASLGNLTNLVYLDAHNSDLGGLIPASLGKLHKLVLLDLSHNRLNGSVPREILELSSLSLSLDLSNNFLSGPIPSEVGALANLNTLSLSGNQFTGNIPDSIGGCEVLEFLSLDRNTFDGGLPQSLGKLKGLNVLNLTMNSLSGRIPDALGSIGNLQQLGLAHNRFSGPVPETLQSLKLLWSLDVSFNDLRGRLPDEGVFRNLTYPAVEGNGGLCGGIPSLLLPPCPALAASMGRKRWPRILNTALPVIGAVVVVFVSAAVLVLVRQTKLKQRRKREAISEVNDEQFQRVSYHTLSRGTDGFSEANLLGRGRYGSVYRCTLEEEEEGAGAGAAATVAVKVFNLQQSGSSKSFEAECETLRRVRHRCLLKIVTCCSSAGPQGEEFKALVFEFMANGSLDDWIHPRSSNPTAENTLSLSQRLGIAADIFDALDYLHNHSHPSIVHCDLKPSNVLLADDMSARIGDFGISRILPLGTVAKAMQNSESSIGIRGSIGYIAPEYAEGCAVSGLGDVYSLGILLLEMFTGRSPTDDMFKDSLDLHRFAAAALPDRAIEVADQTIWLHEEADGNGDVVHGRVTTSVVRQCLVSVLRLGISCSKQQPRERVFLADAVTEMHSIRDGYLRSCSMVEQ